MLTLILFLIALCSFSICMPMWVGLKLQVNDPNCKEEVNSVKRNILAIKICSSIEFLLVILYIILLLC